MEQRRLGHSELRVSAFGLGTMTFGAETDESEAHAILDRFVEAGGTFIDTADVYAGGASEAIVGSWLARRGGPEDLAVATKGRFGAERGGSRDHLTGALEASLRRLGVETVDLYQLHAPDPGTPLEETLETLDGFVRSGKAGAVGLSNFPGWQLERAASLAEHHGWAPIVSHQPQYNLLTRDIELDSMPVCLDRSIGILPWSPLGGGWLTGKYSREVRPGGATRLGEDPTRGVEAYDLRNTERTWAVLEVVEEVAEERGAGMAQVALNWVRQRPAVASVLVGARTVAQLEDNLASAGWSLSESQMETLTQASAPGIPIYPHGFLEVQAGVRTWEQLGTRRQRPYGS